MDECFKCGIPASQGRLFDVISDEGIVRICEKCSFEEHMPIIRKPTTFQLKESERKQTVYERLSHAAGITSVEKEQLKQKQETTLRDIVERSFEKSVQKEAGPRPEMIDNFHWIIMRARRMKKLTQQQLAKEIAESEAAIKIAEQGILPEDDYRLVNKLENYLGIKIVRPEFVEKIRKEEKPKELSFDLQTSKELTISDLKEMREKREIADANTNPHSDLHRNKIKDFDTNPHSDLHKEEKETEIPGREVEEDYLIDREVEDVKEVEAVEEVEEGLSQEDMDKILFGK